MTDIATRSQSPLVRFLRGALRPLGGAAERASGADLNIVAVTAATVLLCGVGMSAIYMAEWASAEATSFARTQGTYVIAALAAMIVMSMVDYRRWGDIAYPAFLVTLVLLALLIVARKLHIVPWLIPEIRHTYRWIQIGPLPRLQPSEFAKVTYICALAWYLRYRTNYRTLAGLTIPLAMSLVPMVLILLEPDLGTVLLLLPVCFSLLYVAGARRRHLISLALICIVGSPLLYRAMHDYQRMRVLGPMLQSDSIRNSILAHPGMLKILQVSKTQVSRWNSAQGYQTRSQQGCAGHRWLGRRPRPRRRLPPL